MNTAACITRFTMIAAALAAAITVQAATPAPVATVASAKVIELPMITVTGKRVSPVQAATRVAVVEMPMISVTGKRRAEAGTMLVANKSIGAAPLKQASRV